MKIFFITQSIKAKLKSSIFFYLNNLILKSDIHLVNHSKMTTITIRTILNDFSKKISKGNIHLYNTPYLGRWGNVGINKNERNCLTKSQQSRGYDCSKEFKDQK